MMHKIIYKNSLLNSQSLPVSVIIPCFNSGLTIKRAIQSVFSQNALPQEVIIVDDCSEDNTRQVLNEIAIFGPKIMKIITLEKNSGASSARNAGWGIASQPYIAFLDADDSWHPEKLLIQYEFMKNNPVITLCGTECIFMLSEESLAEIKNDLHVRKVTPLSTLFRSPFSTPTVMVKRDIPFRFKEGQRFAEDIFLWQKIAFARLSVARIQSPLANVHKPFYGSNGLSRNLFEMEKYEIYNFISLYKEGQIKLPMAIFASIFSIIKFLKRLLVARFRELSIT